MPTYQRPMLKRIGVVLVLAGFAMPLLIHFGRDVIYRWLSGGSTVPNQDGMLILLLAYVLGIPGGIVMIILGGVLFSLGRKPPRGGAGFDVLPAASGPTEAPR